MKTLFRHSHFITYCIKTLYGSSNNNVLYSVVYSLRGFIFNNMKGGASS